MAWTYAKTDWQNGEWFDIENYNRIKGNIEFIHEQGLLYFGKFSIIQIEDKTYDMYCFEEFFNDIEQNINTLINKTLYFIEFDPTKHWVQNEGVWTHDDVNRIERTLYKMKDLIEKMLSAFIHSGTTNSGMEGIRV